MKVTIEVPNDDLANLVIEAINAHAHKFELRRLHFKEEYERVQSSKMDKHTAAWRMDFFARKGAESKVTSDALWDIAEAIYNQVNGIQEDAKN